MSNEINHLPQGWAAATLGDVGEYPNGRGFKKSEWAKSGRPIIRIQDLTGTTNNPNYFDGECEDRHVVRPGDLLISWAATLGVYVWDGPEAVLNQHIFKVRSFVDQTYHRYLVQEILDDLYRQAIVDKVERRLSVARAAQVALLDNARRASRLRQSILKDAFEGKLVEQDPTDEPASTLLARIQAERAGQTDKHRGLKRTIRKRRASKGAKT